MAGAAEAALDDFGHGDFIGSCTHLEAEFSVADLAAKPDAVKPVRKDDRSHAVLVRLPVNDDVGIFGPDRRCPKKRELASGKAEQYGKHDRWPLHGALAAGR